MRVENKWLVSLPGFLGLGVLTVSTVGIVLSVGTLLTVSGNQQALIEKTIEQYVSILKSSGLPQEVVDRFKLEESIAETAQAVLDEDQKGLLREIQRVLDALKQAASMAAEQSRYRSRIGLGVCTVGATLGVVLIVLAKVLARTRGRVTGGRQPNEAVT